MLKINKVVLYSGESFKNLFYNGTDEDLRQDRVENHVLKLFKIDESNNIIYFHFCESNINYMEFRKVKSFVEKKNVNDSNRFKFNSNINKIEPINNLTPAEKVKKIKNIVYAFFKKSEIYDKEEEKDNKFLSNKFLTKLVLSLSKKVYSYEKDKMEKIIKGSCIIALYVETFALDTIKKDTKNNIILSQDLKKIKKAFEKYIIDNSAKPIL